MIMRAFSLYRNDLFFSKCQNDYESVETREGSLEWSFG